MADPVTTPAPPEPDAAQRTVAVEDTAKASQEDSAVAGRLRLGEQAALMMNVDYLLVHPPSNVPAAKSRLDTYYNNFCVFRATRSGGGADPYSADSGGGHLDLTRHIYRNDAIKNFIKNSPGSLLSILRPSLKLYKVFYPTKESVGESWRIPFDDISVSYSGDEKTSVFQSNDSAKTTVEELLSGTGGLHGIGIKSFSYKYVGVNPAEVNTNIEADLTLFFQSVADIVKEIKIVQNDGNFEKTPDSSVEKTFSYADLVTDLAKNETVEGRQVPNPRYFRIKAVVGYQEPDISLLENMFGKDLAQTYIQAIRSAKVILFLNPHNHDITFEENGSITITIKYIAAMSSIMANLNALALTDTSIRVEQLRDELNEIAEKQKTEKDKATCSSGETVTSAREGESKENPEEKRKRVELFEKENQLDNERNKMYSEVFRRLIALSDGTTRGKIYSAKLNKYALGIIPEDFSMTSDVAGSSAAAQQRIKNLSKARTVVDYTLSTITEDEKKSLALAEFKETSTPTSWGRIDPDSKETANKVLLDKYNDKQKLTPSSAGQGSDGEELYEVKFVYLGDVFDIFCDVINNMPFNAEKPKIILSEFNLEIPVTSEMKEGQLKANYQKITVNVADLPVSINMLQNFFIEKLVRPRRDFYSLMSVLYDMLVEVVTPAISPAVFGSNSRLNKMIRMSSITIGVNYKFEQNMYKDCFTNRFAGDIFSGIIMSNQSTINTISTSATLNDSLPFGNYLIFYCSNQLPNIILKNNGDEEKDENNGIYHYFIGTDSSLIKKISFSRNNTPFYKEAKAQNSTGNRSLGRLREVYDTSITMFGNNIYRPGDYLFIEPLFFRGREAINLEQKIGLGGYYQIIDVGTKINENIYETSISAVLYGHIEEVNNQKRVVPDDGSRGKC